MVWVRKKLRLATAAWGLISASVRDSSGECIFEGILMKKKIMGAALLPQQKEWATGLEKRFSGKKIRHNASL